ncbi:MAG TPA: DUF5916 domain-containing protein, partial [Thermoanaerobaculia bacterium]|nr:DUF5916 domain-containing protein [Thermoanaerobaculia bacterium]
NEVPRDGLGSPLHREPLHKDAGLDVKWTPTTNNALDMTVNPDFSQVESDVAQITVNQRFAVFFPEKRPFFLEGFDLFDMPLQVVYTRTITSPRWGLRSTGRVAGSAYTVLVTGDRGGGLTIIPGAVGSSFALQDFKSTDTIGRIRHDLGQSFVGAVFTDREIRGGGYNRVIGPDFQWRPNQNDAVTAEFLYSSTENPKLPGLSPAWNGARSSSHAFHADWNHSQRKYDYGAAVNDLGDGFRADLGFLPQVGYRDVGGFVGLRFYPEGLFRFVRTSFFATQQFDTDGNTIYRRTSPGINVLGAKNLGAGAVVHLSEQYRVGKALLDENYLDWFFQIDPSRRFTRVGFNGFAGQRIDFANGRVGNGATLALTSTVRPIDKLTLDANLNREWLDIHGGRLYTASVERLKATYSFSAKSLLRIIGQYVSTDRNPGLYTFRIDAHDSAFLGSILYSYKLNWQTVLFVGYGDDRILTANNDLAKLDRSLFFKISYAIQR